MKYKIYENVQNNIKVTHQGIDIVFHEDVIKFCKNLGFKNSILSFLTRRNIKEERLKNTIEFFKSVVDYTFNEFKKRNLNIEKIKKTFSRLEIFLPENDDDHSTFGAYINETKAINLYIVFKGEFHSESNEFGSDSTYELTLKRYASTFIHEIGHSIEYNFLSDDAVRYWKEGWESFAKSKEYLQYTFKNDDMSKKDNKSKMYLLKQNSINELLNNFKNFIKKQNINVSSNKEIHDIYKKAIEELENGFILKYLFENKDLNIFKENFLNRQTFKNPFSKSNNNELIEIGLSDLGKIYILSLLKNEFLVSYIKSPMSFISYFESPQKLANEIKSKIEIDENSNDKEIENILCTKIFKSPFNINYDPLKRNNNKEYNFIDNPDYEDLKLDYLNTPTEYSNSSYKEDFAETFMFYVLKPNELSDIALTRIKKTLNLSKFYGQKLEEKLLRKLIKLLIND